MKRIVFSFALGNMDWQLKLGVKKEEVERILVKMDLSFKYDVCYNELIIPSSGVTISFDEDNNLFCINIFDRQYIKGG